MKLFQQLLVAPAALGLMAPIAATATELNIEGVSNYSDSIGEVKSMSQFSDVYPTDWAYQALTTLAERHGCVAAAPGGSMTRYEAAALLNKCLGNVAQVNDEERRLLNEFGPELAVIKGRIDGLEARVGEFEAGSFSTTTSISGSTTFVIGGLSHDGTNHEKEATTFSYKSEFDIDTSFNGDDLLKTTIMSGNMSGEFGCTGLAALEVCGNTSNALEVDKLYYQFPYGDDFSVTVGAKIRQDDMLAVWPSAYPGDSVLDVLTYAGANAAYSLAEGAGAGISYSKNNFSASLLFVSDESTDSNVTTGGVLSTGGSDDITGQIAWSNSNWTIAGAYTVSDGGVEDGTASAEKFEAYGISAVYQTDTETSLIPSSISAGMGWKSPDKEDSSNDIQDEETWSVGLLWDDMFKEGNTLGFAVGTAEGHRDESGYDDPMAYELYYSMSVSDNITITPAIFHVGQNCDGTCQSNQEDGYSGALVKTTFSF